MPDDKSDCSYKIEGARPKKGIFGNPELVLILYENLSSRVRLILPATVGDNLEGWRRAYSPGLEEKEDLDSKTGSTSDYTVWQFETLGRVFSETGKGFLEEEEPESEDDTEGNEGPEDDEGGN
jgi:hypothetical protein